MLSREKKVFWFVSGPPEGEPRDTQSREPALQQGFPPLRVFLQAADAL